MGLMYYSGERVPQNFEAAFGIYHEACQTGHAQAQKLANWASAQRTAHHHGDRRGGPAGFEITLRALPHWSC